MDLGALRDRLTRIDAELLQLVAERQRLSQDIARVKRSTGHPTRDYARERDVLLREDVHDQRRHHKQLQKEDCGHGQTSVVSVVETQRTLAALKNVN